MTEIPHVVSEVEHSIKKFKLTAPVAIIIGAVIIALAIVAYGFIVRGAGPAAPKNPLPKMLRELRIDRSDFEQCLNTEEFADEVIASIDDGTRAGVEGTPATFVLKKEGGIFYEVANISGAQDKSLFKAAIDQALALQNVNGLAQFKGRPIDNTDFLETEGSNVYLVEYSDTECPFCMRLHPSLKELRTEYAGRVSFVYRHFPLVTIHSHAQKEAEMISCVGKLEGKEAYFDFIDKMFEYKLENNIGYLPVDK